MLRSEKAKLGLKFRNKLLNRQIKRKFRGSSIPTEMEEFLPIIDDAYDHYEETYRLLNRALEISSKELNDAKSKLNVTLSNLNEINHDLLSSIHCAKLIQEAILPSESAIKQVLPESFLFYRPRDIVSGDFYWLEQSGGKILIAAVDCTGHGVPGAFMSIIGNNQLNATVKEDELTTPGLILDRLSQGVSDTLSHTTDEEAGIKDGMDIALVSIDYEKMILEYAGAYNPLYIFRDGKLLETKGDKFPIGVSIDDTLRLFKNHEFELQKGDCVYIFSDGYPDQFGGPRGKKYKYEQFRQLLFGMHTLPMEEQKTVMENDFVDWMGELVQLDDVLVIGMRL
ncbi:MAG: serine phosphatase RsbU (regulator of sigma subunit) [Bacteroidia bacterium]